MKQAYEITFKVRELTSSLRVGIRANSKGRAWEYAFHYANEYLNLNVLEAITVNTVALKQDKN